MTEKLHIHQDLYPFWYIEKSNKDRLCELISKKINTGPLSKEEQLELSSLKIKVWRLRNV